MTTVLFIPSVQGHQIQRVKVMVDRLRNREPGVTVEIAPDAGALELLKKHKLQFGPAVVIDGRLEFVGVPHMRLLLERIAIGRKRAEQGILFTSQWEMPEKPEGRRIVSLVDRPAAAPAPKEAPPPVLPAPPTPVVPKTPAPTTAAPEKKGPAQK